MRLQLDTEIPSKIQNMQYKTILACVYSINFLVADGESGFGHVGACGTPFPTGTADQVNSYLREAAISIEWFRGWHRVAPLRARKSGQDNSQGQASEYFECTRKHLEHRYNIIDNHALKKFYDHIASHK